MYTCMHTCLLGQQNAVRLSETEDDKGELAPLREEESRSDGGAELEAGESADESDDEGLERDEARRHTQHERRVGPGDAHVDREAW